MKYHIYSDPAHAWCKVPKSKLQELGIANQISYYSYMKGNYAYLEEDADLMLFVQAMKNTRS